MIFELVSQRKNKLTSFLTIITKYFLSFVHRGFSLFLKLPQLLEFMVIFKLKKQLKKINDSYKLKINEMLLAYNIS